MRPYSLTFQVEVAFSGTDDKGDVKAINSTPMKVLPPWMIKQGMNLTKEQRGESSQEAKMAGDSVALELSDDKKSAALEEDDKKNIQVHLKTSVFPLRFPCILDTHIILFVLRVL